MTATNLVLRSNLNIVKMNFVFMSFFDNTKIAGWALFFAGLLMIISAIVGFYDAFADHEGAGDQIGYLIIAFGALLGGLVYFGFGNKVRTGAISEKIEVVARLVVTVAVCTVITSFFGIIGQALIDVGDLGAFGRYILWFIFGLIIAWIGKKINDGKTTTFDKIIWIILVVVFVILFLVNLVGIVPIGLTSISAILSAIIYLFMLVFMFDGDVKKKMGM